MYCDFHLQQHLQITSFHGKYIKITKIIIVGITVGLVGHKP